MWTRQNCLLTPKDFTLLETMMKCGDALGADIQALLAGKLSSADVIHPEEMPASIVTLNSRVSYRVGDALPETRIINQNRSQGSMGLTLPITTLRGMALLGMGERQAVALPRDDGAPERITVEKVLYQPEAASRRAAETTMALHPGLRLVHGATSQRPKPIMGSAPAPDHDDPGPSAA